MPGSQTKVQYLPDAGEDPYARVIEQFLGSTFPELSTRKTEDVMEAVMAELVATKEYRAGPQPNPESLVRMRDVVRKSIQQGHRIPMLIPSAAVKVPVGQSRLDLAELSALRMVQALQDRVQRHYPEGLDVRVRLEDLTEYALSDGGDPQVRGAVQHYMDTLLALVHILDMQEWFHLVPESSLMDQEIWDSKLAWHQTILLEYLQDEADFDYAKRHAGLQWPISEEMKQYFFDRYRVLYPNLGKSQWETALAMYFATITTRRELRGSGSDINWAPNGQLELSFATPLPDAPMVSTRLYYRTVPRSQSSFHLPPWRGKGHLRIPESGTPRLSVQPHQGEFICGRLEVQKGEHRAFIQADYILE